MVGGKQVHEEENKEVERLCLIENNISVDISFAFLDYRTFSDNEYILEWSIVQLARIDVCKATMLTVLAQLEKHGGHLQIVHADKLSGYVRKAVGQLIEHARSCM